eukprot:Nk52_evm1s1542 gene=Nk52_evmTU1s1542
MEEAKSWFTVYWVNPNGEKKEEEKEKEKTFCLSVLMTNMSIRIEVQVRELLLKRCMKFVPYHGEGETTFVQVVDLDSSSQLQNLSGDDQQQPSWCYYCLMKGSEEKDRGDVMFVFLHSNGSEDETGFELFKPDLNAYCERIYPRIFKVLKGPSPDQGKFILTQILGRWFECNMMYVQNTVELFGERLAGLIYAALDCWKIELVGDPTNVCDAEKFVNAVSFSSLLNVQMSSDTDTGNVLSKGNDTEEDECPGKETLDKTGEQRRHRKSIDSLSDMLDAKLGKSIESLNIAHEEEDIKLVIQGRAYITDDDYLTTNPTPIVRIELPSDAPTPPADQDFSNPMLPLFIPRCSSLPGDEGTDKAEMGESGATPEDGAGGYMTNSFCEEWARAFTIVPKSSQAPVILRKVVENYKLKGVQEINSLKRLLQNAENDYYALYKTNHYLRECGNGDILLNHLIHEAAASTSSSSWHAKDVLATLHLHRPSCTDWGSPVALLLQR